MNGSFDQSGQKKSLLQIREEINGEIEELDANSPVRKRKHKFSGTVGVEGSSSKKVNSRRNSTSKKRVIKFTSGEPYLEYLPNMLSK